jgi:hypothetical protein
MHWRFALVGVIFISLAAPSRAQLHSEFSDTNVVPAYSPAERATAFQQLLNLAIPPKLAAPVSVNPNAPFALDGTHLDFWKTSFVLGTPRGGEAGVNFWGAHNGGHINIGFQPGTGKSYALDCRLLSAGGINYKVFMGHDTDPSSQGEFLLLNNHFLLVVPGRETGTAVLVELWPTTESAPMGFLGCELSAFAS